MSETLRLTLYSPRHPSVETEGSARGISHMAMAFLTLGCSVRVAHPRRPEDAGLPSAWNGVDSVPLPIVAQPHVPKSFETNAARLFAEACSAGTDVAVANNEFGAFLPSKRAKGDVLGIVALHGLVLRFMELEHATRQGIRPRLGFHADLRAVRRLEAAAIERADHVIAISDGVRADAERTYGLEPERSVVIYNGYDPVPEAPALPREEARQRLGLPPHDPLLVLVGGDPYRKGLDVAVGAVRELRRRGEPAFLLNVGNDLPSSEGVRSYGKVGEELKRQILSAGDLLLVPSRYECDQLPLVGREAAAFGLPLLVSEACGFRADDSATDHLCVRGWEPSTWAEAVASLLHDPERKATLAAGGRRSFAGRSYLDVAKEYLDLFHRLDRAAPRQAS